MLRQDPLLEDPCCYTAARYRRVYRSTWHMGAHTPQCSMHLPFRLLVNCQSRIILCSFLIVCTCQAVSTTVCHLQRITQQHRVHQPFTPINLHYEYNVYLIGYTVRRADALQPSSHFVRSTQSVWERQSQPWAR